MKKELSSKKVIFLVLIIMLITFIGVFVSLVVLQFILGVILSSQDGYLLTGLAFCILCGLSVIILPIILYVRANKKNKNKKTKQYRIIRNSFKNNKKLWAIGIISIIVIEALAASGGSTYLKDIQQGPVEAIMINAELKVTTGRKGGKNTYIVGNVDGKQVKLKVTRDARSNIYKNQKFNIIKIKYYRNLKEVYQIKKII